MYGVLRLINGVDIERAHNLGRHAWLAIDDTHHLAAFRGGGVGLQRRKLRECPASEILCTMHILLGRAGELPAASKGPGNTLPVPAAAY